LPLAADALCCYALQLLPQDAAHRSVQRTVQRSAGCGRGKRAGCAATAVLQQSTQKVNTSAVVMQSRC
jgi:hypothetical protein